MGNIKLVADSNSDLTDEIIQLYNISMVSQYVNIDGVSLRDRVDISSEELNKKISSLGKFPKTAAPSPSDFTAVFKPAIENGQDILCICTSSNISATYQNAVIAARDFPSSRIEVVNSMNISMGIGMVILNAVDLIEQGFNIHEIAEKLNSMIDRVRTVFVVDTLEYLRKGGRCTALESFVGDILKIRPVLAVSDGKLTVYEKFRGNREKVLKELLNLIEKDKGKINKKRILISHFKADEDVAQMKDSLQELFNPEQIIVAETGCSVSSHCGPNTVGIIYLVD